MSKTLLCLFLLSSFLLFFASGTPLKAGDPWAWPPEAGDDPNPDPTDKATISGLNASSFSDTHLYEGFSGRTDGEISREGSFFTKHRIGRETRILRAIWFDLLTEIFH